MYLNISLFSLIVNYIAILGMWQKIFMTKRNVNNQKCNLELGMTNHIDILFSQSSIKSPISTILSGDQLLDRNRGKYLFFKVSFS
jgi:hypothetical protein